MEIVDDALVETLQQDLDGQVSRQQIVRAVNEIAARFEKATVTAFVPIFIRRQARKQLEEMLANQSHPVASSPPAEEDE
jgi:hypothetical protein